MQAKGQGASISRLGLLLVLLSALVSDGRRTIRTSLHLEEGSNQTDSASIFGGGFWSNFDPSKWAGHIARLPAPHEHFGGVQSITAEGWSQLATLKSQWTNLMWTELSTFAAGYDVFGLVTKGVGFAAKKVVNAAILLPEIFREFIQFIAEKTWGTLKDFSKPRRMLTNVRDTLGSIPLRKGLELAAKGSQIGQNMSNFMLQKMMLNHSLFVKFFEALGVKGCLEEYACRQATPDFCDCTDGKSWVNVTTGGAFKMKCHGDPAILSKDFGKEWTKQMSGEPRQGGDASPKFKKQQTAKKARKSNAGSHVCGGHADIGLELSGGLTSLSFELDANPGRTLARVTGAAGLKAALNLDIEGHCNYTKEFAYPKVPLRKTQCGSGFCIVLQLQWVATLEVTGDLTGAFSNEALADLDFDLEVLVDWNGAKLHKNEVGLKTSIGLDYAASALARVTLKLGPRLAIFPIPGVPLDFYPTANLVLFAGGSMEAQLKREDHHRIMLEEPEAESRAPIMLEAASALTPAVLSQANASQALSCVAMHVQGEFGVEFGGIGFPKGMEMDTNMVSNLILSFAKDQACRLMPPSWSMQMAFGACMGRKVGIDVSMCVCQASQQAVEHFVSKLPNLGTIQLTGWEKFFEIKPACFDIMSKGDGWSSGPKGCLDWSLSHLGAKTCQNPL